MTTVTSVRLPSTVYKSIALLAKKEGRSKNSVITRALEEYLEQQSIEEKRWQDTLCALDSVHSKKLMAGGKVDRWLKTWGTNRESSAPKK